MNLMVITNQKSTIDTNIKQKKEFKHNTKDSQVTRSVVIKSQENTKGEKIFKKSKIINTIATRNTY